MMRGRWTRKVDLLLDRNQEEQRRSLAKPERKRKRIVGGRINSERNEEEHEEFEMTYIGEIINDKSTVGNIETEDVMCYDPVLD